MTKRLSFPVSVLVHLREKKKKQVDKIGTMRKEAALDVPRRTRPPSLFSWFLSWVSRFTLQVALISPFPPIRWASLVAQLVKNPPAMQESTCNAGDPSSILGS